MRLRASVEICSKCNSKKCEKLLPVKVEKLLNGGWFIEYPETIKWQRLISIAQDKCKSLRLEV